MLTHHRLEDHAFQLVRVLFIAYKITVDPQPVHIVVTEHFALTHHRYVVLCMTGHHAGAAAITGIHIDVHTPFDTRLIVHRVKGCFFTVILGLAILAGTEVFFQVISVIRNHGGVFLQGGQGGFADYFNPVFV